MIQGVIIEKGETYYTDLYKLLDSLDGLHLNYKWLVSHTECSTFDNETYELFDNKYVILSGDKLMAAAKRSHQFWWGTFSAFDPSISDDEILKYPLPENDMYPGFWKLPLTIQHPLAQMELVAWDASLTLVITKDIALPEKFRQFYPLARDLAEHNAEILNK